MMLLQAPCPTASRAGALCTSAQRPARSRGSLTTRALFGRRDPEKEAFKEEQYRLQQELLQRRRSGAWQKEVQERRADVSKYMKDKDYRKKVDEEKRKRFLAQKEEEDEQYKGFRIIIPLNPIGLPEYDGGERFDLRGKYVDEGWVDPESGIWSDDAGFLKKIGNFFGGGKKKGEEGEQKKGGK